MHTVVQITQLFYKMRISGVCWDMKGVMGTAHIKQNNRTNERDTTLLPKP